MVSATATVIELASATVTDVLASSPAGKLAEIEFRSAAATAEAEVLARSASLTLKSTCTTNVRGGAKGGGDGGGGE